MIRRVFLPSLLLCLAIAPGVQAQDNVDQLSNLIKQSATSADPVMAFISGFESMSDFEMNQAQVRSALTGAGLAADDGVMGQLLGGTTKLSKKGGRLAMARSRTFRQAMPGGAGIEFGKKVEFQLSSGFVGALSGEAHDRLKDAEGHYVHLGEVDGVKVSKDGDSYYNLYELYFARENDKPVVHLKAGVWFHKEWNKIELPSPEAAAEPEVEVVATAETDALPSEEPQIDPAALSSVVDAMEPTDLPAPTVARDDTFTATIVDESDLAAPEDTVIAQIDDTTGILGALNSTSQQQGPPADRADEIVDATVAIPSAQQAEEPTALTRSNGTVSIAEPNDSPIAQTSADQARGQSRSNGSNNQDKPLAKPLADLERPSQTPELSEIVDAETALPVRIPAPEEKARIDTEAEETRTALDAEGSKLDEILALLKKDQAAAEARMEARIQQLEEQNKRLEERLIALTEKLEEADGRALARRNRDDYAPRGRYDDPRYDDPRYDSRRNDDFDRRYDDRYDSRRNDPRYDDPRYDDRRAPITTAEPEEKKSALSRILAKVMEGIKKGLAQRAANEQARNMALRTAVAANGNPANYGYADWAMRNSLANSNMGATVGYTNPNMIRPMLTTSPNGVLSYNRVPVTTQPNGYYAPNQPNSYYVPNQPNYAPVLPNYNVPTTNLGTPLVTGPSVNNGYAVPITPVNMPLGR